MADKRDARPDLCELVGVAVGSSTLVMDPERERSHLATVAALGGAVSRIALNLDNAVPLRPGARSGVLTLLPRASEEARQLAGMQPPGKRDTIEARLAPLLWRMKYGDDRTPETAIESVRLFARWLAGTPAWQEHPVPGILIEQFCARVIYEWMADKCPACRGTGVQELLRNGVARRPKRFGDPNVRHVQCRACRGTTRSRPDAMARARVLDVSLALYRALWASRMDRAGRQLARIARRLIKPLRSEMDWR